MKDLVLRLASMKLAEMKFDVEVIKIDSFEKRTKDSYPGSSLKKIKELIKINFMKEDLHDFNRDLHISQDSAHHVISQDNWYDEEVEIVIDKPKSMSLALFRKIMRSAGLDDERKVAQLIKGREK